ncbi:STAS domain-containing protein [Saccharothrix luteola]|uniref:STAS domain-containing protein n=1 Tax=Saccharothrix luteola TaxID=2893018 RepID=UPI001E2E5CAA|nr:STAS domain-containing protein [Saccharothrix luteola]MCC8246451.1 STAS domain-containing protein [Saccharothrix luteola]
MITEPFSHSFRVDRQVHGYAVVVRVAGEVDAMTVCGLKHELAISLALATPPAPVVVDLSEVDFFAAAGLNELHRGHLAAQAAGVPLRVVAGHRHVLRPFEISGLDQEITPCSTLAEALVVRTPRGVRRFALPAT